MNRDYLPKDKRLLPTEGEEQARLFSWCKMQSWQHPELGLLFHVPNGGSRNKAEAGRFKAEGVKSGVPDLMLPVARGGYHGLFIELKRLDGGRVAPNQKAWMDKLKEQGYLASVCRGWEEASEVLLGYLALEDERATTGRPYGQNAVEAPSVTCGDTSPRGGGKGRGQERTAEGVGPYDRNGTDCHTSDRTMGTWAGTSAMHRNDLEGEA